MNRKRIGISLMVTWLCLSCGVPSPEINFEPRAFLKEDGGHLNGEFAYLTVPERHEDPESGSIKLAVARFRALDGSSGPPIIYLEGGPGGPADVCPPKRRVCPDESSRTRRTLAAVQLKICASEESPLSGLRIRSH